MSIFGLITTSHSHHYTEPCLSSFFRTTALSREDRVILIDNNSDYVPGKHSFMSEVEIIRNGFPQGFAANGNTFIRKALEEKTDLFFFNNDLIFTPNWINLLLISTPTIVSPLSNRELQYVASVSSIKNEKIQDLFTTVIGMSLSDYLGHEPALEYISAVHQKTAGGHWPVYVVPFFCVKLPYEVMRTVGLFDESFGKGGAEDYDYCFRAHLLGFGVQYALGSYILHFGGKSSWSGAETTPEQHERERIFRTRFEEKWGPELTELVLYEKTEAIQKDPLLREADKRQDCRFVIERLSAAQRKAWWQDQ